MKLWVNPFRCFNTAEGKLFPGLILEVGLTTM